MTREELQALNQEQLREIAVGVAGVIKQYIDENTISPSQVEDLERAKTLAESLLGIFDSNEDGAISLDEFIAKLNEIYATLEGVQQLQTQITQIAQDLGALTQRVNTIEANMQNFITFDDAQAILTINKDEIVNEVRAVFYPQEDGDGATL